MTTRRPLVLVPQFFGSTVFDRRTSRYTPFDQKTTDLLRLAHTTSIGQIIDEAPEAHREAMGTFASVFYERGFFTYDLRFNGDLLDVEPPQDHLTGPLAVHLEVVAACNLSCTHCFAGELPRREPPLSLSELDTLFATMARMGAFRLGLTGGEPLLRKDLIDILDLATHHGLHPCLTTNALLLDEAMAKKLGARPLVWLNVSLDGATAETNDPVRGEGTFQRVLDKIAMLREHARFTLAFTVMKHNAHETRAFAEFAARIGAHTAVFRPLYPVGTAETNETLWPSFDDYERALDSIWTLGETSGDRPAAIRAIDAFSPRLRHETRAVVHDNSGCGAGNTVCSISVGGDVNPCSFLGPHFIAENVRRKSFEDIWHASEKFRLIRGLPGDGTGTATFGGGCRARSLVMAGDVNAPDPWLVEQEKAPTRRRNPLQVLRTQKRTI